MSENICKICKASNCSHAISIFKLGLAKISAMSKCIGIVNDLANKVAVFMPGDPIVQHKWNNVVFKLKECSELVSEISETYSNKIKGS